MKITKEELEQVRKKVDEGMSAKDAMLELELKHAEEDFNNTLNKKIESILTYFKGLTIDVDEDNVIRIKKYTITHNDLNFITNNESLIDKFFDVKFLPLDGEILILFTPNLNYKAKTMELLFIEKQ